MCIGEPAHLFSCQGIAGTALIAGCEVLIDLSLTPDAKPGDWLLCFLGAARRVIDAEEAAAITAALAGLRQVLSGKALGTAFADLEARPPQLPPHLQAALEAGRYQG